MFDVMLFPRFYCTHQNSIICGVTTMNISLRGSVTIHKPNWTNQYNPCSYRTILITSCYMKPGVSLWIYMHPWSNK